MARDKAPKGAQGSNKPPTSKASGYQARDPKNSEKLATGANQLTEPTKLGRAGAASALREATGHHRVGRSIEHDITRASVRLLSAKDARPTDVVARVELRRMVDQVPAEKLQQAIKALKAIITPGRTEAPVVAATDAEVMAAADQFIRQYKPALDRLAKR